MYKDPKCYTYTQLYDEWVCPILNYAAGIWAFKEGTISDAVLNRAICCFLGI